MFLLCDEISGQVSFSGTTFANQTSSLKIRMNFNVERKVFLELLLGFFLIYNKIENKYDNKQIAQFRANKDGRVHFDLKFVSINYQTL